MEFVDEIKKELIEDNQECVDILSHSERNIDVTSTYVQDYITEELDIKDESNSDTLDETEQPFQINNDAVPETENDGNLSPSYMEHTTDEFEVKEEYDSDTPDMSGRPVEINNDAMSQTERVSDATTNCVKGMINEELSTNEEHDSNVLSSSTRSSETDNSADQTESNSSQIYHNPLSASVKRRRITNSNSMNDRQKFRRTIAEIKSKHEVHKQLCTDEITLLEMLIQTSRVEMKYGRTITELKEKKLDLEKQLGQM